MKPLTVILSALAAIAAFIASFYWFKASRTNLPVIDKATGKAPRSISMSELNNEIVSAARLNRVAAAWSGVAALLGAVSLALGSF